MHHYLNIAEKLTVNLIDQLNHLLYLALDLNGLFQKPVDLVNICNDFIIKWSTVNLQCIVILYPVLVHRQIYVMIM